MPSSPPFIRGQALAAGAGGGEVSAPVVSVSVVSTTVVVDSVGAGSVAGAGVGPAVSAPSSPQPDAIRSASRANEVAKSGLTVVSFIGYLTPMMAPRGYGTTSRLQRIPNSA